jgi:hypothetical protein
MVWSRDGDGDVTFPAREGMSVDGLKARVRCEPVGTTLVVDWDMAWCCDDVKANGCEMVRGAEVYIVNQMARCFLHTYLTIILSYHSESHSLALAMSLSNHRLYLIPYNTPVIRAVE